MEFQIHKTIQSIQPPSIELFEKAKERMDSLTKPKGSLGVLEEIACRYLSIHGEPFGPVGNKAVVVFAADHGVAEEGVSAYPQEVTAQMVFNFLKGGAAINVLALREEAQVIVVDIGVNHDFESVSGLVHKKIARGTRNMTQGPSMTRAQAEEALQAGVDIAAQCSQEKIELAATGEMGIGNTTASAAVLAAVSEYEVESLVGRGTGINNEQRKHKILIVKKALEVNQPKASDPLEILAKVGGFEIAGIAGFILGAAAKNIPVIVDGLISGAAAVIAHQFNPKVADYIFPSHRSNEPGHRYFFETFDFKPLLELDMRLGEGTGAVLAMNPICASVNLFLEMATFSQAQVSGAKR